MRQDYERDMNRGRRFDSDEDRGEWRGGQSRNREDFGQGYRGDNDDWYRRDDGPYAGQGRGYNRDFDRDFESSRERDRFGYGNERQGFGYGNQGQSNFGEHRGEGSYGRNYGRGGMGFGADYDNRQSGFYGQSWRGQGGQTGQQQDNRSDEEIRDAIYDRMDDDWEIPESADIDVKVENKVVTLTGTVRSRRVKDRLSNIVNMEPGVRDVHNTINVMGRRHLKSSVTSGSNSAGTTRSSGPRGT